MPTARDAIAEAVAIVCSDGNSGSLRVADRVVAALRQHAFVVIPAAAVPLDAAENAAVQDDDALVWAIFYDDTDRHPEVFSGCGATMAAQRRFAAIKQNWNCHLFVRVAHG